MGKIKIIEEAFEMLRSQGIRIPKKFQDRVLKNQDFAISKSDVKQIEKAMKIDPEDSRVIVMIKNGHCAVWRYSSYVNLSKNAAVARDKKAIQNGQASGSI